MKKNKEVKRCQWSGRGSKVIKRCGKEATRQARTIMGTHYYCTRHANLSKKNPYVFEVKVIGAGSN